MKQLTNNSYQIHELTYKYYNQLLASNSQKYIYLLQQPKPQNIYYEIIYNYFSNYGYLLSYGQYDMDFAAYNKTEKHSLFLIKILPSSKISTTILTTYMRVSSQVKKYLVLAYISKEKVNFVSLKYTPRSERK
uniref:tRNA-intron lyase n=1 Tax=Spironucleus salmonicida TaxID=348837 RepID=V6LBX0_9EUKA|eukprot:EST41952.1 hypothetical protein SS50377_18256 [Spironucleus salmonicida]